MEAVTALSENLGMADLETAVSAAVRYAEQLEGPMVGSLLGDPAESPGLLVVWAVSLLVVWITNYPDHQKDAFHMMMAGTGCQRHHQQRHQWQR